MLKEGMIVGERYEIISRIGSGGMADVYKAKDHKLNRLVAVKVMKAEFSQDKGFISKFRKEAQAAAGLAHPNVVNVYDVGEDNGIYYKKRKTFRKRGNEYCNSGFSRTGGGT